MSDRGLAICNLINNKPFRGVHDTGKNNQYVNDMEFALAFVFNRDLYNVGNLSQDTEDIAVFITLLSFLLFNISVDNT